jgi:hypothetical protein
VPLCITKKSRKLSKRAAKSQFMMNSQGRIDILSAGCGYAPCMPIGAQTLMYSIGNLLPEMKYLGSARYLTCLSDAVNGALEFGWGKNEPPLTTLPSGKRFQSVGEHTKEGKFLLFVMQEGNPDKFSGLTTLESLQEYYLDNGYCVSPVLGLRYAFSGFFDPGTTLLLQAGESVRSDRMKKHPYTSETSGAIKDFLSQEPQIQHELEQRQEKALSRFFEIGYRAALLDAQGKCSRQWSTFAFTPFVHTSIRNKRLHGAFVPKT